MRNMLVAAVERDVWLPIATLALGYLGSLYTEAQRDRRAAKRERLVRASERQARRADREADFQRETLLSLQDALFEALRGIAGVWNQRTKPFEEKAKLELAPFDRATDAVGRRREALDKITLLSVRVKDDEVRRIVEEFQANATTIDDAKTIDATLEAADEAESLYASANHRIGELIRDLF
jgi:hypothetical protein